MIQIFNITCYLAQPPASHSSVLPSMLLLLLLLSVHVTASASCFIALSISVYLLRFDNYGKVYDAFFTPVTSEEHLLWTTGNARTELYFAEGTNSSLLDRCKRTYIHAYIHTYIRTYLHTYIHTLQLAPIGTNWVYRIASTRSLSCLSCSFPGDFSRGRYSVRRHCGDPHWNGLRAAAFLQHHRALWGHSLQPVMVGVSCNSAWWVCHGTVVGVTATVVGVCNSGGCVMQQWWVSATVVGVSATVVGGQQW